MLRSLRAVLWVVPVLSLAWGCESSVDGSDEGEGGCTEPKPDSGGGFCASTWTCIDGEWEDTGGDCPDPCPEERPVEGSACDSVGAECPYWVESDEECGEPGHEVTLMCTDAGWSRLGPRCQPPPECPEELPTAGSDCTGWADAYYCSYTVESSCGELYASAYCDAAAWTWNVELPAACTTCDALLDAASCSADVGCRWLVPGCSEPALPAEGCFPVDDCTGTSCDEGEVCSPVVYDPCWNSSCDACGAEAMVCLAGDG